MVFRKVTSDKFVAADGSTTNNGYTLCKGSNGLFYALKDGQLVDGIGFLSFKSAGEYLNSLICPVWPITDEVLYFVSETYSIDFSSPKWSVTADYSEDDTTCYLITMQTSKGQAVFNSSTALLIYLDGLDDKSVFASVSFRGTELRSILGKSDRRSAREASANLIRVKSSNLWSYGMELKDTKSGVGDVYIQFKGKNGGPVGGLYRYYDVPVSLWRKFVSAPSKGAFFWKYIRNNFLYSKLDGDKRGKLKNAVN